MAQCIKPLLAVPASNLRTPVPDPAVWLLIYFIANLPGKPENDAPGAWALATNMGDPDGASGSCLWADVTLALKTIWRVTSWLEISNTFSCLFVTASLHCRQIKILKKILRSRKVIFNFILLKELNENFNSKSKSLTCHNL